MKSFFHILLSAVLLLSPSGCTRKADSPETEYQQCLDVLASGKEKLVSQDYDTAMEESVKALSIAEKADARIA